MNRVLKSCLFAVAVSFAGAAMVSAQDHVSARINALGGEHVSGMIPDVYTDIVINPAYAYFSDRFTIDYGRRSVAGFQMPFPYFTEKYPIIPLGNSSVTNELTFYGMRRSSWRSVLSAEWAIASKEIDATDSYINMDERINTHARESLRSYDRDFWKMAFTAARPLGESHVLGLRLKAFGNYETSSSASVYSDDYYSDFSLTELASQSRSHGAESYVGRDACLSLEAGIARSQGAGPRCEVVASASGRHVNYDGQTDGLDIDKDFDTQGETTYYSYNKNQWSDTRKGNLWTYGLSFRHTLSCGTRILAGGSFSTASYDAGWLDVQDVLSWNLSTSDEELVSGAFSGGGSLHKGAFILKCGKSFTVHRTVDLYVGVHGAFARTHAKETPVIRYSQSIDAGAPVLIDQPVVLEATITSVDVYFPLSIEFKPSSCFSYFAGFTIRGGWNKREKTRPLLSPFYFNEPDASRAPSGASRSAGRALAIIYPPVSVVDWDRTVSTGYTLTLGFSFHYGEKLFVDAYTGTDIIPQYWDTQVLDVRYAF